jgi:hypothetical protein
MEDGGWLNKLLGTTAHVAKISMKGNTIGAMDGNRDERK